MLLLQEFDLEIRDKKGSENSVADHLSRLHVSGTRDISDSFPDEHLLAVSSHTPWFAHIVNFLVTGSIPEHWNQHRKDKFFHELKYYYWEEPLLFHVGYDQIIRRSNYQCVTHQRVEDILPHGRQQIRFYKAFFIGPPSSRMLTVFIRSAYNAKQH